MGSTRDQAPPPQPHGRAERGYVALIEIFLPRAHRLAEACVPVLPEAYARAGVAHFERSVGAQLSL